MLPNKVTNCYIVDIVRGAGINFSAWEGKPKQSQLIYSLVLQGKPKTGGNSKLFCLLIYGFISLYMSTFGIYLFPHLFSFSFTGLFFLMAFFNSIF